MIGALPLRVRPSTHRSPTLPAERGGVNEAKCLPKPEAAGATPAKGTPDGFQFSIPPTDVIMPSFYRRSSQPVVETSRLIPRALVEIDRQRKLS